MLIALPCGVWLLDAVAAGLVASFANQLLEGEIRAAMSNPLVADVTTAR